MLEASREAIKFSFGITLSQLETDRLRMLALMRCIEIIGEAAAAITSDFREAHPSIPWRVIIAMRNRLIHAYFDVDLDLLFDTIHNDLPKLITSLSKILTDFDSIT